MSFRAEDKWEAYICASEEAPTLRELKRKILNALKQNTIYCRVNTWSLSDLEYEITDIKIKRRKDK